LDFLAIQVRLFDLTTKNMNYHLGKECLRQFLTQNGFFLAICFWVSKVLSTALFARSTGLSKEENFH